MNANDSKSDNRKSIGNVGVLDIRNATEESVDSIRSIGNVGTIVHSPETARLASRLSIGNVGNYFEVTGDFRTHNGHLTITRDFFKGLSSPLSLVVNGHIQVDADVEPADINANLAGLSINGHLMCPENLVGVIQGKIRNMNGHIQTYVPGDRLYLGRLRIDDTYLRTLPDDSTLTVVGRIVVVGGNEDRQLGFFGCLEQRLDVLHRVVFRHTLANDSPGHAVRAEEIVLWIGDDERGAPGVDCHSGVGQCHDYLLQKKLDANPTCKGRAGECAARNGCDQLAKPSNAHGIS